MTMCHFNVYTLHSSFKNTVTRKWATIKMGGKGRLGKVPERKNWSLESQKCGKGGLQKTRDP